MNEAELYIHRMKRLNRMKFLCLVEFTAHKTTFSYCALDMKLYYIYIRLGEDLIRFSQFHEHFVNSKILGFEDFFDLVKPEEKPVLIWNIDLFK